MTRTRVFIATALAISMFAAGAILLAADGGRSQPQVSQKDGSVQLIGTEAAAAADVDATIATLQERVRGDENPLDLAGLGAAYLQKARQTADPTYYALADKALARALELDSVGLPALLGSGELSLARHDFSGALRWGKRALDVAEVNATALGIIGDAHVGLGNYHEAFGAYQKMVDLRPDLSSFARVSYARELTGDAAGAIDAMRRAAAAGALVPENEAWTSNQLGDLYFSTGAIHRAALQYRTALRISPDFTPALAGLARVDAARGDLPSSISEYQRVVRRMPLPQYVIALGDVYSAAGKEMLARDQYDLVRVQNRLYESNGVLPDVEITLFFADQGGNPKQALELARSQYKGRKSIQVADALAWTLYRKGNIRAARLMSKRALRLGTRDALINYHAGMIALAANRDLAARRHLSAALKINKHFSLLMAPDASKALARLGNSN